MVAAYRYRGHSFQILNLRPSIPHWIPGYPHVPPGVIVPKRSICVITDRRTMRLATTRQTKVPRSPWGRTTPPCTLHHSPKPFPFGPTISSTLSTLAIPTIGVVPLPKIQEKRNLSHIPPPVIRDFSDAGDSLLIHL